MDELLQSEKQKYDDQRKKQKRLIHGITICLFTLMVGLGGISISSLYRDLSKQNIVKLVVILVAFASISGLVEYIKKKKIGDSRSAVTEIIHVLIFLLMSLSMALFVKF